MNQRRKRNLTRVEVIDAALELVDAEGLDALTMRRLGSTLGVEAMALYRHVPNKDALLDLTVERMRSEMRLEEPLPHDPAQLLEAIFVEYRRVLTAHPNMLPLATRRTDTGSMSGLEYLIEQGVPSADAVALYQSLTAFTIGYSLLASTQADDEWSNIPDDLAVQLRDWGDDTFRRTLRAIMAGFGLTAKEALLP